MKSSYILFLKATEKSGKECSYDVRKVADIFQIFKYRWDCVIKLFWMEDNDLKL